MMNGESIALKTDVVIFPLQLEKKEIVEIETGEISRVKVEESKTVFHEARFARLKKALRKRSANIF